MYNIKNDEKLKSISINYNGRKNRFSDRVAEYWKFVMPEAVADVLAIVNFGAFRCDISGSYIDRQ